MEVKLSSDGVALVGQLCEAERFNTKARAMLAFSDSYLDLAERQRLVPYDRGSYTDTDRNIENETRVGLTPDHIRRLISTLQECGIELRVSVAQAAGIWAGFRDRDFVEAGAEIVDWKKLAGSIGHGRLPVESLRLP